MSTVHHSYYPRHENKTQEMRRVWRKKETNNAGTEWIADKEQLEEGCNKEMAFSICLLSLSD